MGACVSCGKDDGKLEDPTVIVLYALCVLRKPEKSSATPYPSIFFSHLVSSHLTQAIIYSSDAGKGGVDHGWALTGQF